MRKFISLFLTLIMLSSALTAFAATEESFQNEQADLIQEAENYAYLDIETAAPALKEKILEARKVLVYTKEWVADGYTAYVEDEEGNIIRTIPSYSEVFPGWELPESDATINSDTVVGYSEFVSPKAIDTSSWRLFNQINNVYLREANSTPSSPFWYFYAHPDTIGNKIKTVVTSLRTSKSCNISFSDFQTDKVLGYAIKLGTGQSYVIGGVGDKGLFAIASTYSTPGGYASFSFYGADRLGNTWD